MKRLLLILFALLAFQNSKAQVNEGDLLIILDWFSWDVVVDGDFFQRPTPNAEQEFLPMNIDFNDPFNFTFNSGGCGSVSLNIEFIEGFSELVTGLVTDVVVTPDACDLEDNNEYSNAYYTFLQSLEGEEAEFMISVTSPAAESLGFVILNIYHPNGDFGTWADAPLSTPDFELQQLSIFPNPAVNTLQWENPNGLTLTANVYSIDGKLLISDDSNSNAVDLSGLASGVYLLELSSENGRSIKRFVKQ